MQPDSQNTEGRVFWDLNPCGTSATWEMAQEVRFKHTDPFLKQYLNSEIFKKQKVLEVGCGQGLDAAEIVQTCRSYVGFDISNLSVNVAKREVCKKFREKSISFLVGNAESMPFPDHSFDVVYSYGVLHHTSGFEKAIGEILRVLKPGGKIMIMLYRSFTPLWLILRSVRGFLHIPWIGEKIKNRGLALSRDNLKSSCSITGTFFVELIGCPIIETYTLSSFRRLFDGRLQIVYSECFRVGFDQIERILPARLRSFWPQSLMEKIEDRLRSWLGFYLVIVAK